MDKPDFDKLRAERNARTRQAIDDLRKELGWSGQVGTTFDPNACYCACPQGPCEHKWIGKEWTSDDGCAVSSTCSRCGSVAMYHDMRVLL